MAEKKEVKKQTALDLLLAAVAAYYKEEGDQTTAGLVLAKLDDGTFYASVVRYPAGPYDKHVVLATGKRDNYPTATDAIVEVANRWHRLAAEPDVKSAVDALGFALKGE